MKRRLLIAAAFLLAGAVVNVAVAWGCWRGIGSGSVATKMTVEEARDFAADLGLPAEVGLSNTDSGFGTTTDVIAVAFSETNHGGAQRIQVGWPSLALRGYPVIFAPDDETGRFSNKRRWALSVDRAELPFPLLPIWPGFAVNTLFYAAVLWLLVWGSLMLRRRIRRMQGFCPACAYPMGESAVCSECGRTLPRVAT